MNVCFISAIGRKFWEGVTFSVLFIKIFKMRRGHFLPEGAKSPWSLAFPTPAWGSMLGRTKVFIYFSILKSSVNLGYISFFFGKPVLCCNKSRSCHFNGLKIKEYCWQLMSNADMPWLSNERNNQLNVYCQQNDICNGKSQLS